MASRSRNWIWNFAGRESSSARVRQECRTSGWQTSFVMQSCSKLPDVKLRRCWTGRIPRFLQKRLAGLSCRCAPAGSIPTGSWKLVEVLAKTRVCQVQSRGTELGRSVSKKWPIEHRLSLAPPIRRNPTPAAGSSWSALECPAHLTLGADPYFFPGGRKLKRAPRLESTQDFHSSAFWGRFLC